MKKIYYEKFGNENGPALAEYHDGNWEIESATVSGPLKDDVFQTMFEAKDGAEYVAYKQAPQDVIRPAAALDAGTHRALILGDKEAVKGNHENHPDAWYLDPATWSAYRFSDFPIAWAGFVNPGEPIDIEENEVWGTQLIALNPIN